MMGHGMEIQRDCTVTADKDIMEAVTDYFELSLRTQKLCTSLRQFVKKSRDDQIIIDRALVVINEGQILLSEQECKEIMEELRIVRGEVICVEEFESVYNSHAEMQRKLGIVQTSVDKKIKGQKLMKGWSIAELSVVEKLSNVQCVEKGLQDVCEGNSWLKSQLVLVEDMNLGTFVSCKDVETMRVLVDLLHCELGRTAKSIEFGERHGDSFSLLLCMQDLRNKQPQFLKHLEGFERQAYDCNANISKARAVVLQKLITCLIH
ncbi:hypothetical protein SUGI_0817740 [Cryptomeria japonica]|nr:hypothetical protein SUGI_0817740 [Cryptomeria japonica]